MAKNSKRVAKPLLKQFIVRKYVMAMSVADAVRVEKNFQADDCWVSEEFQKAHLFESKPMGFRVKK